MTLYPTPTPHFPNYVIAYNNNMLDVRIRGKGRVFYE